MMAFQLKHIDNWSYYYLPELEAEGVIHGFFTMSSPSYTLSGEDKRIFLEAIAVKDLVIMDQVHGDGIHIGRMDRKSQTGDGIIIMEPDIAGVIKTADCLAVVLADPTCPMAAIVHAGWKGTVKRITEKAARKMVELGANENAMIALFGPSIRPCCYEVGEEVRNVFKQEGFSDKPFLEKKGSLYLDLVEANREQLARAGVTLIHDTGFCTHCSDGLFASYRRGDYQKRQINFVSLRR